jgi:hypothetical protein
MPRFVRYPSAAAAVVAIALIGCLPTNVSSPGPSPTPTPLTSPEPLASPVLLGATDVGASLPGGRYVFQVNVYRTSRSSVWFTAPPGWVPEELGTAAAAFAGPAEGEAWLGFYSVQGVYIDPCHPELGITQFPGLGHNDAADIAEALRAMVGFESTTVSTVRVPAQPTLHFVLSNSIDTAAAGCTDGALLPLFITWDANPASEQETRSGASPATNGGTSQEIWLVGLTNPVLIVGEVGGEDPEADRSAIQEIVDSVRVGPAD